MLLPLVMAYSIYNLYGGDGVKFLGLCFLLIGVAAFAGGIFIRDEGWLFRIFLIVFGIPITFAGWAWLTISPKRVEEHLTIPAKVGMRSYIDNNTGTIYLRSHDYHTKFGEEWIVSNSSLTIKKNMGEKSEIIPLSKIQTMRIENNENRDFNRLSFSILGTRSHFVAEGIFEDRVGAIAKTPITFQNDDIKFAEAICERIASATTK